MRRKQNLASALGIQKEKLRVTMHFSKIIKLQFGKNAIHCFVFYWGFFLFCLFICFFFFLFVCFVFLERIVALLSLKNARLPQIFFLDFNSP